MRWAIILLLLLSACSQSDRATRQDKLVREAAPAMLFDPEANASGFTKGQGPESPTGRH